MYCSTYATFILVGHLMAEAAALPERPLLPPPYSGPAPRDGNYYDYWPVQYREPPPSYVRSQDDTREFYDNLHARLRAATEDETSRGWNVRVKMMIVHARTTLFNAVTKARHEAIAHHKGSYIKPVKSPYAEPPGVETARVRFKRLLQHATFDATLPLWSTATRLLLATTVDSLSYILGQAHDKERLAR